MQRRWAISWGLLLLAGWLVEIVAAISGGPGDTLSEHAWWLIGRVRYINLAYTAAWSLILGTAVWWTVQAHRDSRSGDRLPEFFAWVFARPGVGPVVQFALVGFFSWLVFHFTLGLWAVPEWILGTCTAWLGWAIVFGGKR